MKRREFLKTVGAVGIGTILPAGRRLDTVRVGVIGLGARGTAHVELLLLLDGVDVKALSDVHAPAAEESAAKCARSGRTRPELYTEGENAYRGCWKERISTLSSSPLPGGGTRGWPSTQ